MLPTSLDKFTETLRRDHTASIGDITATIHIDLDADDPQRFWGEMFGIHSANSYLSTTSDTFSVEEVLIESLVALFESTYPLQSEWGYGITSSDFPCGHCNADGELKVDGEDCSHCDGTGWLDNPLYCGDLSDFFLLARTYRANSTPEMPVLYIAPIYTYVHSGVCHSLESFSCRFDSGISGFAYALESNVKTLLSHRELPSTDLYERWLECVSGSLATLNDYLAGECYWYSIVTPDGALDESVCGYIGDSGIDAILSEVRSTASSFIEKRRVQRLNRIKALIKNRVPMLQRASVLSAMT